MIFLGGTSGFHYGQVVLQIHLSVGQLDFLTKFDPWPVRNASLVPESIDIAVHNTYLVVPE